MPKLNCNGGLLMENRDRDKLSRNDQSIDSEKVNRNTSEKKGRVSSDSNADFGQNIGRSEKRDSEPSRGSGSDSSTGKESSRRGNSSSSDNEH
jgi:hypothetical protein